MEFKKITPTVEIIQDKINFKQYINISYSSIAGTYSINLHTVPQTRVVKGITVYDMVVYATDVYCNQIKGLTNHYNEISEAITAVTAYIQAQVDLTLTNIIESHVVTL